MHLYIKIICMYTEIFFIKVCEVYLYSFAMKIKVESVMQFHVILFSIWETAKAIESS